MKNYHLCYPGCLPVWLHSVTMDGHTECNNVFYGMYGPGFVYDPWMNVMYADWEAVDAACTMAEQMAMVMPGDWLQCPDP